MRLRIKLLALALLFVLLASTGAVAVSAQDRRVESTPSKAVDVAAAPLPTAAAAVPPQIQSSSTTFAISEPSSPIVIVLHSYTPAAYIKGTLKCGGELNGNRYFIAKSAGESTWHHVQASDQFPINADGTFEFGILPIPSYYCFPCTDNPITLQFKGVFEGSCSDDWVQSTTYSNPVTVSFVNPGVSPVANAGTNKNVVAQNPVTLDGSKSTPQGQLTYLWTLITKPTGSAAKLVGAGTAKPTFIPDKEGTYKAKLIVKNAQGTYSTPATVIIKAYVLKADFKLTPDPPYVRDSVVFDASTSSVGSSKITLYKWTFKYASDKIKTTDRGKEVLHTFDKPGTYYVALEVYNSVGLKHTTLETIVVGDKWAVIVGISNYPKLSHIKGVESARQVRTFLMQKYHFDGSPGPQSHIISRIDADATRSGIMSALTELSTKTSSHDLVVFYIAAHGDSNTLCPYDSHTDPKKNVNIWAPELGEKFAKIPSRATIIIINSCHSGSFVPQSTLINEQKRVTTGFEAGVCGGTVQLSKIAKYIIMASSEDGELTYGAVFTTFLMHGFNKVGATYYAKDTNHNNWLSIGESGAYAEHATFDYCWKNWQVQVHPAIFISDPSRDLNVEYIGPLT